MADAMCNGSTPLKGLVDHHSTDNSLHTGMRLGQGHQDTQTFRNAHSTNSADQTYGSFMGSDPNIQSISNGPSQLPMPMIEQQMPSPLAFRLFQNQQAAASTPTAIIQASIDPQSLMLRPAETGLHFEHPQPFTSPATAAFNFGQRSQPTRFVPMTPVAAFQQKLDNWVTTNANVVQGHDTGATSQVEPDFSEVDDIMDKLAEDLARDISIDPINTTPPDNSLRSETDATLPTMESAPDVKHEEQTPGSDRPSEISEVARQILVSVEHEDDEKWKNSTFLALMRDFRDATKDIVDDRIQDSEMTS